MPFTLNKLSFIIVTIGVSECAKTMKKIEPPFTIILTSIGILHSSVALLKTVNEAAVVCISVLKIVYPLTMDNSILPFAFIPFSIRVFNLSEAMKYSIFKLTLIDLAIRENQTACISIFVIFPVSFINGSIIFYKHPSAFSHLVSDKRFPNIKSSISHGKSFEFTLA